MATGKTAPKHKPAPKKSAPKKKPAPKDAPPKGATAEDARLLDARPDTADFRDRMFDFNALNELIGTPEMLALGETYKDFTPAKREDAA